MSRTLILFLIYLKWIRFMWELESLPLIMIWVEIDVEGGSFWYHPSKAQWFNFERVFHNVKSYAIANSRVYKIVAFEVGALKEITKLALLYFSYTFRTRENGTIAMRMTPSKAVSSPEQDLDILNPSSKEGLVGQLDENIFKNVADWRYNCSQTPLSQHTRGKTSLIILSLLSFLADFLPLSTVLSICSVHSRNLDISLSLAAVRALSVFGLWFVCH